MQLQFYHTRLPARLVACLFCIHSVLEMLYDIYGCVFIYSYLLFLITLWTSFVVFSTWNPNFNALDNMYICYLLIISSFYLNYLTSLRRMGEIHVFNQKYPTNNTIKQGA